MSLTTFIHDNLNRLTDGAGNFSGNAAAGALGHHQANWELLMAYDNMNRIVQKTQLRATNNNSEFYLDEDSYDRYYQYSTPGHPNAVSSVYTQAPITYNNQFTYDANGNTLVQNDAVSGKNKSMHWDEDNMMRGIVVNDNKVQHNLYDAAGERTAKAQGTVTVVSVNGSIVTEEVSMGNYTLYPSGYLVVSPSGQYTKHYYNGSERIASKIAGAATTFQGGGALSGTQSPTLVSRQTADLTNIISTEGFENLVWANPATVTNPCTGLTGEALKQCLCANGTCTDVIYFFHPDHLGSSTFLTDYNGQGYEIVKKK